MDRLQGVPTDRRRRQLLLVFLFCIALFDTAQGFQCALKFYLAPSQEDHAMFTGLTAQEKAESGNTNIGHRLTCACVIATGITPRLWVDRSGAALPLDDRSLLVDYKPAPKQPGSAIHFRVNKGGFSCAEAGNYTCVVGVNRRSVLVTPIGDDCSLLPPTTTIASIPTTPTTSTAVFSPNKSTTSSDGQGVYPSLDLGPIVSPSPTAGLCDDCSFTSTTDMITSHPSPRTNTAIFSPNNSDMTSSGGQSVSPSLTPGSIVAMSPSPTTAAAGCPCVSDVSVNSTTCDSITIQWTNPPPPSTDMNYKVLMCSEGVACLQYAHSGLARYRATDLAPNTRYTITVMGGECSSRRCTNNTAVAVTKPTSRLLCVSNVLVHRTTCTSVSLRWEEPARGLSYRVGLCQTGLVDCSFHYTYSCSDCSSYQVTGLLPNRNYTFTVDSFVSSTSEECSSQSCSSNTVTATTEVLSLSCIGSPSDYIGTGVFMWAYAASLLVVLILVITVVTFTVVLCTRMCRRSEKKGTTPPSPGVNCTYYDSVEVDRIEMQPSPGYASVSDTK